MKKYDVCFMDIFSKALDWGIALYGMFNCEGQLYKLIASIVVFIILEYLSQVFITNYVRENINLFRGNGFPKVVDKNNKKIVKLIFRTVYLKE